MLMGVWLYLKRGHEQPHMLLMGSDAFADWQAEGRTTFMGADVRLDGGLRPDFWALVDVRPFEVTANCYPFKSLPFPMIILDDPLPIIEIAMEGRGNASE